MPWPFRSTPPTPADTPAGDPSPPDTEVAEPSRWDFEAATPIAPGRPVLKRLGGGTRYEVYLAWDERLCSLVVAKILRPDRTEDARALQELEREAEMVGRLAHPILLRGFGAVLDGPHPHLVVEHLEGPTLRRLIRRGGSLPLEQLLPLAINIAAALHYLSVEEVVHLDVKPSNIVMGVPPRLIDLSLARTARARREAAKPDRHRRLHGTRAVRSERVAGADRPAGGRLRPRGDAAPRDQR